MSNDKSLSNAEMVAQIGPVTRRELDHLRAQRARPAPALEYTMGGQTQAIVNEMEQERRAVRETYIESRLRRVDGRASNDFKLAAMRGQAKRDFDHSR